MKNMFANKFRNIINALNNRRGEVCSPNQYLFSDIREPDKTKRVKIGKTIFVVSTYFSDNGNDSLKDILERTIKREVSSNLNS